MDRQAESIEAERLMSRTRSKSGDCAKCGTWRQVLQRDHIVPRSIARKLGWSLEQTNATENLQFICANCHQDKSLAEIAAANCGRVASESTRAKLSAAQTGRRHSEATRLKMRKPHRSAPPRTAEHRARQGRSNRRRRVVQEFLSDRDVFNRRVADFVHGQGQGDAQWLEM